MRIPWNFVKMKKTGYDVNMNFPIESYVKRVEKPWGYELKITQEDLPYCGKVIYVKPGMRWSVHYHDQKKETLFLFSGEAEIWLHDGTELKKFPMKQGQGYLVTPMQTHRVVAITECVLFEASEPEKGTTVRVEDDHSRSNEDDEVRKDPKRGWNP